MKTLRTKILAITVALILILSITASLVLLPTTNAHTPPLTITAVYCYTVVAPNIIGIGQTDAIIFWSNLVPPTAVGTNGDRWSFMLNVTAPDGKQQALGPFISDPVGNGHATFVPDEVGNYTFTATVLQHKITGADPNGYVPNWGPSSTGYATVNDTYVSATSLPATLVVQQEPIASWPAAPLPTDYWTRPINAQNREWWTISGNWYETHGWDAAGDAYYYKGGGYNPYTVGPTSAHIVWVQPMPNAFGGLIGGTVSENGGVGNYYTGMSYEQFWGMGLGPWIVNGYLYYNCPVFAQPYYGCFCVDLATGKQVWYQNYTITNAQVYNYISPNQFGGIPYLWNLGSTYSMYNAANGNWILSFTNCLTGTVAYSPTDGSLLVYIMGGTNPHRWLAMWNSSLAVWANMPNLWSGNNYWLWRPETGATSLNWTLGVQWNVTEPAITGTQTIQHVDTVDSNVVLCTASFSQSDGTTIPEDMAYSAADGALLWGPVNRTAVAGSFGSIGSSGITGISNGVYVDFIGPTMSFIGYSITSGTQLWGPTLAGPTLNGWTSYGNYRTQWVGDGRVYLPGMDGYVHCLNITNGQWLWDFCTGSSGLETEYGNWPLLTATFLGGAPDTGGLQVYAVGGHTHLQPMYRGAQLYDVNGSTGDLIWSISGWYEAGAPAGADGYMVAINGYDNQLYCFGQGPSRTTVTTPGIGVTTSTPVTITGTVTDISTGSQQDAVAMNFPNGLPCVSDDSQSQFMEAVYMQQPRPTNVTGVPVSINVIDSNGNFRQIGTTTTDASGTFAYTWTPDIPGDFTIIANFEGSKSYYPSSAEAHFTANNPAPTASPYPVTAQPPTEMYFAISTVAIIAAIAIIGALIMLMLRKRP